MARALCSMLLVAAAGALAAQEPARAPRTCTVQADSIRRLSKAVGPDGAEEWYGGGGAFFRCAEDETRMRSDSFAWFPARQELRMLGDVHFRDSTSLLDADRLTYWVRQERLVAEGNVYTRNTRTGSDLTGPNLDYYRAVPPIRDTVDLRATGRPTIRFYSTRDTVPGDSVAPFVIVADRVRMRGNDRMWAGGSVTIDREQLAGRGDSAALDLGADRGYLIGSPEVTSRDTASYRLTGTRIAFDLTPEHDIRRVIAQGQADAQGTEWRLRSDTLDMQVDSGRVQRAQAWGRESRSTAVSSDNTIVADSLDIHMPAQVVRLVWAYGRARAASEPDSTAPDREEDWLAGDTLKADFLAVDSGGTTRSELDRLTAFGSARAYYHTENRRQADGPRGINYSRGRRIEIAMRESKVHTVDIVGQVDGVYLEPAPPPDSAAADSLGADSLRADSLAADTSRARRAPPDSAAGRAPVDSAAGPARPRPLPADSARPARRDSIVTRVRPPRDTTGVRPATPPRRPARSFR
jgi:hypothetical protein